MAQQNMRDAQDTYGGFIGLFKWGTVAVAAIVGFVILIIS